MPSEFILSGAIQSEPVGTLAECLQFSDVISLALVHKLIDDCDDETPDEWDDPEKRESLIPGLLKVIPESFEKNIRWLQREDTALIGETVRLMAEAACFPDELTPCFHFLENMGYIYLFAQDGQLWPVLPDELSAIWKKVMADGALTEELMFNQELCEYAIALAKLYGAYETEQLAEVWNRHHTNKITVELAGQLLGETENFQEQYWLSDGLVISELVFDYEELDELFENMKDTPYYMPTKSVIAQYADDDRGPFDENRPELKSMMEFLKTAVPDDAPSRDDLDYDIVRACTEEWTGADVAEMLLQYDFPLGDSDAVETFTRLYQSLFENTRLRTLRGDTPANYAKATGSRLTPFSLPSLVPRRSKKTGRNAPCPCGSGKKYKRCCGA